MPTTQTVWEQPNWTIHYIGNYNQGVAEKSVLVCLHNAVVTAANSHINNYLKDLISLQPVGPLSSVGPWASAPWSLCINASLCMCIAFLM